MSLDLTAIDSKHLQELYGEDKEILSIIFESFLEDSLLIWNDVGLQIDKSNLTEAGQKIHQIKPNFSMVGLTSIYPLIQEFEREVKNATASDLERLKAIFADLDVTVQGGAAQIKSRLEAL